MKHILKYSLGCLIWMAATITTLSLVSCDDDDPSSNLDAATYPKSVIMDVPAAQQALIYIEEGSGASVLPLVKGETVSLSYTFAPDNITFKEFDWTSNNPGVATIDQNGLLTAVSGDGTGYAIIQVAPSVFYSGSNIFSTLKVIVVNALTPATSIIVSSSVDEIFEGETLQMSAVMLPENATYRTIKWTSSNESIATVDVNGLVSGLSPGNVRITAHALDNSGVTGYVDLTINHAVWATDVSIDASQEFAMFEIQPLKFTLQPADATVATVKWESSNPEIASIDGDGVIKTGKGGTVTISATTSNGIRTETAIKVADGFLRKDFSDGTIYPWAVQNNTTASFDGDKMIVKFADAAKYRGDLALANNGLVTAVPVNVGVYRYFAVKMRVANNLVANWNGNGCVVLDTHNGRYNQPVGNGNNNYSTYLKNGGSWEWDKPAVYYYDLQETFGNSGYYCSTTSVEELRTFKFVIADYPKDTSLDTYDVYWIRTFKTLEELKAFVDSE